LLHFPQLGLAMLKTTPLTPSLVNLLPPPLNIRLDELPKPTEDIKQLESDLFRAGYCYIKNGITPKHLNELRKRLKEQMDGEVEAGIATKDGLTYIGNKVRESFKPPEDEQPNQKVFMLLNKGKCFRDLVTLSKPSGLVDKLLHPKWMLGSLWANIVRPGNEPQALHSDQAGNTIRYSKREEVMKNNGKTPKGYGGADSYAPELFTRWPSPPYSLESLISALSETPLPEMIPPPIYCQVVYCLCDVDATNGGTCVVPGSHLTGIFPPLSDEFTKIFPTVNFNCKAGTIIIFDGRLWHAAGANIRNKDDTDAERPLIFQYCLTPNMRQQENIHVGLRNDVYNQCSEKLKERLGYKVWGVYGYTEKYSREHRWVGPNQEKPGEMKAAQAKL
jgi:hypothetical protein